jgi:hypothetical protein
LTTAGADRAVDRITAINPVVRLELNAANKRKLLTGPNGGHSLTPPSENLRWRAADRTWRQAFEQ